VKDNREDQRKNLYIKNLPDLSEVELNSKIMGIFSEFGEI